MNNVRNTIDNERQQSSTLWLNIAGFALLIITGFGLFVIPFEIANRLKEYVVNSYRTLSRKWSVQS